MTTAQAFTVYVNDRPRALSGGATLAGLLVDLGLAERQGVAVAINGNVIGRSNWPTRGLEPEDRVLIIQATQGG